MSEKERQTHESLEQLAERMRRVANGHFDVHLETTLADPLHDIARDFNHMAENLLAAEMQRETFVSNVAHEFKTPLAYIQGYATLLRDKNLTPQEHDDYVTNILNATHRLSIIIGNLLELSNLNRPSAQLTTKPFSLDEQLRHIMVIFMPQIERKSLSYELNLEPTDIEGNAELLEDVWTNLLSNALKYTPDGGSIAISLEQRSRQAIVAVSDSGQGMTSQQIAHAFDRFYQGESSHNTEGTGLGLPIVKAVVEKHHGTVSVSSRPGKGTSLTVILPIMQPKR